MEKQALTPEESFNIIQSAISNLKINYQESAKIFLSWGWVLMFASLSNFVILKMLLQKEAYHLMGTLSLTNWGVFVLFGFILMYFMRRKTNAEKKVHSHLDGYFNSLWTVLAVSFIIGTIICIKMDLMPPILMLFIAGIGTTISGMFIKFKPLIIGGISFFVFSLVSMYVPNEYIALIVSAAILCGYIIPGYLLKMAKE